MRKMRDEQLREKSYSARKTVLRVTTREGQCAKSSAGVVTWKLQHERSNTRRATWELQCGKSNMKGVA